MFFKALTLLMLLGPSDWWKVHWKFNIVELWKLHSATADNIRPLALATVAVIIVRVKVLCVPLSSVGVNVSCFQL